MEIIISTLKWHGVKKGKVSAVFVGRLEAPTSQYSPYSSELEQGRTGQTTKAQHKVFTYKY